MTRAAQILAGCAALCVPATSLAQKVFLNPSDQFENPVAGGGNEAQYAKINADLTAAILLDAGFQVVVDQDFYNAPKNANSWGADVFVSIHSNAGGGHGTVTLYASSGGKVLAGHVQAGLLAFLPYQDRGLKHRSDPHVLNKTLMYAALAEVVFHDCATQTGYQGHPPSESDFLKSAAGQQLIANGLASGICSYFGGGCGGGVVVPPAQKGWFKGVVYRAPDMNDRIPGALVVLNTGPSVLASSTGYWEFELEPGTYTATATADGYQPNSSTRIVVAGQEVWGSIGLVPSHQAEPGGEGGSPPQDIPVQGEVHDVAAATDEEVSPGPEIRADRPMTLDTGAEVRLEGDPPGTVVVSPEPRPEVFSSGGCRSSRNVPLLGLGLLGLIACVVVSRRDAWGHPQRGGGDPSRHALRSEGGPSSPRGTVHRARRGARPKRWGPGSVSGPPSRDAATSA